MKVFQEILMIETIGVGCKLLILDGLLKDLCIVVYFVFKGCFVLSYGSVLS